MRSSAYDDNITRRIADRLISRLSARRGLNWPPAPAAGAAARQPDLLHADAIKNLSSCKIEDLGRELIQWRLTDLMRGIRYAHGIELHKTTVESLSGEVLDFLLEVLNAPAAADEIRKRGLALAQQALEKGIVH